MISQSVTVLPSRQPMPKSVLFILIAICICVCLGAIGYWAWLQRWVSIPFLPAPVSERFDDPVFEVRKSLFDRLPLNVKRGRIIYNYKTQKFTIIGCLSEDELKEFLREEKLESIPLDQFVFKLSEDCQ